jgi:hypothetical protein
MAICYINQTIEISVNSLSMKPETSGDMARTAGNTLRFDVSSNAVKRTWNITSKNLTSAQFAAIYNYLASINFGITYFWLDDFGGAAATDSIQAKIDITGIERVQFGTATGWENNGKNITLNIIEQ